MSISSKLLSAKSSVWSAVKKGAKKLFTIAKWGAGITAAASFGTQLYERLSTKPIEVTNDFTGATLPTSTQAPSQYKTDSIEALNLEQQSVSSSDDFSL